jgi:hypothetical protein
MMSGTGRAEPARPPRGIPGGHETRPLPERHKKEHSDPKNEFRTLSSRFLSASERPALLRAKFSPPMPDAGSLFSTIQTIIKKYYRCSQSVNIFNGMRLYDNYITRREYTHAQENAKNLVNIFTARHYEIFSSGPGVNFR